MGSHLYVFVRIALSISVKMDLCANCGLDVNQNPFLVLKPCKHKICICCAHENVNKCPKCNYNVEATKQEEKRSDFAICFLLTKIVSFLLICFILLSGLVLSLNHFKKQNVQGNVLDFTFMLFFVILSIVFMYMFCFLTNKNKTSEASIVVLNV